MILEEFNCDTFELSFEFKAEDFDKESFEDAIREAEDVERYSDDEVEEYGLSFGSPDESLRPHAHLRIKLRKGEKPSRTELSYHGSRMWDADKSLPTVDDCARWLGGFFKAALIESRKQVGYTFGNTFSSIVPLMFPLATTEKNLVGSYVTGMSLILPPDGVAESAIIQAAKAATVLLLTSRSEVDLNSFDLRSELERLSGVVDTLIRKKEGGDSSGGTGE